jgi:hypothetical protein
VNSELPALIFELQRSRSAADRARALARAWRTLRGLDRTERRLLVREAGFEGAEDLIEGLAGGGHGGLAPAAVLEALARVRDDESVTVRGIVSALRDRDRRNDLIARGLDLVASTVGGSGSRAPSPVDPGPDVMPESMAETDIEPEDRPEPKPAAGPEPETEPETPATVDPGSAPGPSARYAPNAPRPRSVRADDHESGWEPWSTGAAVARAGVQPGLRTGPEPVFGTVSIRLRRLRAAAGGLAGAPAGTVAEELERFPEPWARRRAMTALLEAGAPGKPAEALDLIATFERPVDRRWCLAVLARRGDLTGEALDRALAMLEQPGERRRLAATAARAAIGG